MSLAQVSNNLPEIPEHTIIEFKPKNSRFLVIAPVLNEGERIRKQLQRMKDLNAVYDFIIVDAGSTDGALEEEYLRQHNVRALLTKKASGKLGTQLRIGILYALHQGYEGIILIDGNNKDNPEAIPEFAKKIDEGFDFIQGSRFVKCGKAINNPASRLWGIKLLHAPLLSIFSGFRYTDTTNGFRAFSSKFFMDERLSAFRNIFTGYEYHYYLSLMAPKLGYKVTEIPVVREYPLNEPTPTKIKGFKGNFAIIGTLLDVCFGKYKPNN